MAHLGKSEKTSIGKTSLGVLLILIALGSLSLIGYYYFKESLKQGLTEDLCPAEGPIEYLAILIDTTDPVTTTQLQLARQFIDNEIEQVPVGARLSFSTVSPNPNVRQSVFLSICKPPSRNEVSRLTENPRIVQEKYEKKFRNPVDEALNNLLAVPEAQSSPIMESLQEFASSIPDFAITDRPRNLILMSDLIQHSEALSFYRGESWKSFSNTDGPRRFGMVFGNAEITVLRIPREVGMLEIVDDFWARYWMMQEFDKVNIIPLGDL